MGPLRTRSPPLPRGRLIRGRRWSASIQRDPNWGLYALLRRPHPRWPYAWVPWPDFGLPLDSRQARTAIDQTWKLSARHRVEISCGGDRGTWGEYSAVMSTTVMDGYARWAHVEARGVSKIYYDWATGIAGDPTLAERIAALPPGKRQPNLIFAAARLAGAPLGPYSQLRPWLIDHWDVVAHVALTHATQTNEAGRCAVLLPALAGIRHQPLALIEVGAAAGLCLYPDRYSYRYLLPDGTDCVLHPDDGPSGVILDCLMDPKDDLLDRVPLVTWRAGVDLNPLDVTDSDDMLWLETLIWPEHDHRRARLRAASQIIAQDLAHLRTGDLLEQLPSLLNEVPSGTTPVVFHSAVLTYLSSRDRAAFIELIRSHPEVTWISNEGESVLPEVSAQVTEPIDGRTIVAVNGTPIALAGPHGQSYHSLLPACA